MSASLSNTLLFFLVPIAATIAGGVVASFKTPTPTIRSGIQHFAAGVVFAAAAGELLPDVVHERAPVSATIGFAAGIGLMLVVKTLSERLARPAGSGLGQWPTSLVVTLGIDVLVDGLLIGIGFSAGAREGFLLTVALTVELLFLALSASAALRGAGLGRGGAIGTVVGLALLVGVGTLIGTTLLGGLTGNALETVLAFGLAALLYLVTEELLVEAHEVAETPWTTGVFFFGFLFLLLVEMMSQRAPG